MKIEVRKNGLELISESPQDTAYIEHILGVDENGGYGILVKINKDEDNNQAYNCNTPNYAFFNKNKNEDKNEKIEKIVIAVNSKNVISDLLDHIKSVEEKIINEKKKNLELNELKSQKKSEIKYEKWYYNQVQLYHQLSNDIKVLKSQINEYEELILSIFTKFQKMTDLSWFSSVRHWRNKVADFIRDLLPIIDKIQEKTMEEKTVYENEVNDKERNRYNEIVNEIAKNR